MSCCQCSKARQEGCPWHAAEHDPESTGFSLTLLQNWELLICAQQDAEKATGTSLAQSPPRAAPRHEAARVTRQPSLTLALHICALFHCLQWTCPVMPQTSVVQPKQCCRKPPRLSSVGFYPSETWETIWISSLYQEDMVILPPENTEGRKVPVSHPWKYG